MTVIEQAVFFRGLNFVKCNFDGIECYKGMDNCYYRVDHFATTYVIEFAEDEIQARNNGFEDDDLFEDSLPEEELMFQIKTALQNYTMDQQDIEKQYNSICKKLGFEPSKYEYPEDEECTEDDSKENPFSVLTTDEKYFLLFNGFLNRR